MTRDDMIRSFAHCLDRFTAEVAAVEREACAKVCEVKADRYSERAAQPGKVRDINPDVAKIAVQTCGHLAAVIRARDEQLLRDDQQDGSRHKTGRGNTRLTREQYKEAKRCYEILCATPKMSELARRFGISPQSLVATIRRGIKQYDQKMANEDKT